MDGIDSGKVFQANAEVFKGCAQKAEGAEDSLELGLDFGFTDAGDAVFEALGFLLECASGIGIGGSGLELGEEEVFAAEAGGEAKARSMEEGGVGVGGVGAVDGEGGFALEFGGGGELLFFEGSGFGVEAVYSASDGGKFGGEFGLEFFEDGEVFFSGEVCGGAGDEFLDTIEAGVESGGEFVAGEGTVAAIGFIGIACDAAVAFDQGLKGLEGPVGGFDVGELGY